MRRRALKSVFHVIASLPLPQAIALEADTQNVDAVDEAGEQDSPGQELKKSGNKAET
jgi:hypothetical protein